MHHVAHGTSKAIGLWFGETWGYTILLRVVYGAVVGYLAKELLHWAEEKKYVDRESFLVFAITLAVSASRCLETYVVSLTDKTAFDRRNCWYGRLR